MKLRRKNGSVRVLLAAVTTCVLVAVGLAQRPPMRRHTANQKRELQLVRADIRLDTINEVSVSAADGERVIRVNSIPDHAVGQFPNRGNPHSIAERVATFRVPTQPREGRTPTQMRLGLNFGIAVNGVLFDPGDAEFWLGDPRSGWQYEALGGAVSLGLDENYAHVQPDGKYHYHGIPTGLLKSLKFDAGKHSPLIGWAADGFPIYALNGFTDPDDATSEVIELKPSYRLKPGRRPGGRQGDNRDPGGVYDGTFVNDYEFVDGLGQLDECNGRFCVTPDFPNGTYVYFLTHDWPTIPRQFRGTPDSGFQNRMGPGRGPGPRRPGFDR